MTTNLTKLKEELRAEILAEINATIRKDSAWKKAKGKLSEQVYSALGKCPESYRVLESTLTISRVIFGVRTVNDFTENDILAIEDILNDIFGIVIKYRDMTLEQSGGVL